MPPESRLRLRFTRAARMIQLQGNPTFVEAFPWRRPPETLMRMKKRSGLASPSGPVRLVNQTVMGAAMGLAFALLLILVDPAGVATLIAHGGRQATAVCVGTIVLTFGIGATLSGAIFILTEDP
jgi:hypothetical protein